ncbi:MAG: hypothetical protein HC828_09885 [Blastochloris sp.]|nr:hypothetical protein [Blastochloris sp.]
MARRLSFVLLIVTLAACSLENSPAPGDSNRPDLAPPIQATVDTAQTATQAPQQPQPTPSANQDATPQIAPPATVDGSAGVSAIDDLARIDAADPAARDQTALVEAFKGGDLPDIARTTPLDVQVGDVETFWVSDILNDTNYEVTARLRYAGSSILMYVDTTVEDAVDQADIERSGKQFDTEIYPRNRALFGEEPAPGVDGDPRLTVLNTPLRGAGGYFSSADGVVKAVNRFSNEREMFVIGINSYRSGPTPTRRRWRTSFSI